MGKAHYLTTTNNNTMTTLGELKIGSRIQYTDIANPSTTFVVLDSYTDQFGSWVNVMNEVTKSIEPMKANLEITNRWTILDITYKY